MGEWTAVASANLGVLGGLASDDDVDVESVVETELADMVRTGVRFRAIGRFFSSRPMVGDDKPSRALCAMCLKCVEGNTKEETSLHFD